jgi:hypothetical protein
MEFEEGRGENGRSGRMGDDDELTKPRWWCRGGGGIVNYSTPILLLLARDKELVALVLAPLT